MPLKVLDVRFNGMLRQVVEGKKFVRRIINSVERQTNNMVGSLRRVWDSRIRHRHVRGSEKRNQGAHD